MEGVLYRLLGVAGSLRAQAHSTALLRAVLAAAPATVGSSCGDLGELPLFNADLYVDPLPVPVQQFRDLIMAADGIVISSPEYNHGIPGVLKNALDWASRPHNASPLRNKPVLIMTSSMAFTGGVRAQYQIREILVASLARPVNTPEIVVGNIASKVFNGVFADSETVAFVQAALRQMVEEIQLDSDEKFPQRNPMRSTRSD